MSPRAARLTIAIVLALVLGAGGAAAPVVACEVSSVRATVDGAGGVRVRIAHDGVARVRRQARDDLLVLFLEGCTAAAGAHALSRPPPPVRALRWSHHPENDAVWVVAELEPGTGVELHEQAGAVEVRLAHGIGARRAWPLGFRVLHPLPAPVRELMTRAWRDDCPVPMERLSLVQITHLGFDGRERQGDLVVHADIADEVVAIFAELLRGGCAIERVHLADLYADDAASMAANNSSAFACRTVTGASTAWSVHSHGRAVDLNPVQNPYVRGDVVLPPAGRAFLSRGHPARGLIRRGDACHRPFASRGWTWGGDFESLKDYQHFEKPAP